MDGLTVGFALCGSFCTFKNAISELKKLKESGANVIPIMSYNAFLTDTRFGKAVDIVNEIENICDNKIISTLANGDRVEFRGFGAFSVRKRAPRVAKNPRTGAKVDVDERNIAHFKTGKELHEMLNK